MGLLGKSFRDFVGNQVRKRQEVLGEYSSRFAPGDKTEAFMTNTPWIRLASAVDVSDKDEKGSVYNQMKEKGLFDGILNELTGDNLAKNFILFGGVNNNVGGIDNAYSGLNSPNSTKIFGGAYGFGAWNQLFDNNGEGFKPMPGITNIDFSYRNDGALSQASVTVKAFNRTQFQIIDILFQRPGYTVLLEFGHSVFVDNDGVIQYAGEDGGDYSYSTKPFETLFSPSNKNNTSEDVSHYTLAKDIYSEKEKWNGNYEGAFMKITKYKWKYNTDGSYDITVNLVGIGDIISSLKTNMVPVESITEESGNDENNTTGRDVDDLKDLRDSGNFLIGNALSSTLNLELYKIYRDNDLDKGVISQFFTSEKIKSNDGTIKAFPIPVYDEEGLITSFPKLKELKIPNGVFIIEDYDNELDVDGYNNLCYITFGYLISLITKYINLRDGKTPYLFFDLNYEDGELKNDENFLATYQGNLSSDPLSVLIPFKSLPKDILDRTDEAIKKEYKELIDGDSKIRKGLVEINESFFVEGDHTKGRLERVYLDINYIARTLNENTTDGECKLIDFLDQILNDINNNLGGINNFRIIFNQDKQLASFISEVPANTEEKENLTTINTVGITPGQGSFVKDLDLNAELSDNFATVVSIGAQANGNNLQGNAGSFSLYNKGLIDRIIPIKDDTQDPPEGKDAAGNKVKDPIKNIISEDYIDALEEIYDNFNFFPDYISIISSYNSSITPLITGELMKEKKYPAPFFLPFNLGLTLHGLGGVRIYDGFKVDGKVLPPSYNPESVSLIIKSLSHSVSLDGWTTKIETLSKPIFGEIKQPK